MGAEMTDVGAFAAAMLDLDGSRPLTAAAQDLAAEGVPVFPCQAGGKRPLTRHGFHDASINAVQVSAWWRRYPEANIAIPTGAASGVAVVDVDVHDAVDGYDALAKADHLGLLNGWELAVRTPSGGMHLYFPGDLSGGQRSWQAARAGIDFRGEGGYVIVPPSRRTVFGAPACYQVRSVGAGLAMPVDSDRLRDFLIPMPPASVSSVRVSRGVDSSRLAAWVAERDEGERNRGLFWAACRMAEHGVLPVDAVGTLAPAAARAGLDEQEALATIRSAYRTVNSRTTAGSRRPSAQGSAGGSSPSRARPVCRGLI